MIMVFKIYFQNMFVSSSHPENQKNIFLVLCKGSTYDINEGFASAERSLVLILLRQTQNVAWVYITVMIIVVCF